MEKIKKEKSLKIIPLGGFGEVGRNMMVLEYEGKILIIDIGLRMPEEDMPGVDYIIPNISYLKGKEENILGVIFTHGHYDHIGAVPYVLPKIWHPKLELYASALTRAIILKRQEDFPEQPKLNIIEVQNGSVVKIGPFRVEFFKQNHNIPDNMGLFIETPVGNVINTSDFKFDPAPINDLPTDFKKLEHFSKRGVLLLMSDSTDAELEGHSLSELEIQKNLKKIFENARGRIIAATFGSLLNRIQQIISLSEEFNRKVVIEGSSMKSNVAICQELKYIKTKKHTIISAKEIADYLDSKITILATGAQGEREAVLMRIALKIHPFIKFKKGDTVIFSSSVIPGNERTVQIMKDEILRQGAEIYHYKMMDIHAGGHAQQDELMKMIDIIKPTFLIPIHGQYSMQMVHKNLAQRMGMPEKNILVMDNGQIAKLTAKSLDLEKEKVEANYIMVDGLGIGDVGEVVLRDRHQLSRDGMFVIIVVVDKTLGRVKQSPDIISRGFVYLKESKDLLYETRKKAVNIVNQAINKGGAVNWVYIKDEIRNKIGDFLFYSTRRRPIVLPVVIEV